MFDVSQCSIRRNGRKWFFLFSFLSSFRKQWHRSADSKDFCVLGPSIPLKCWAIFSSLIQIRTFRSFLSMRCRLMLHNIKLTKSWNTESLIHIFFSWILLVLLLNFPFTYRYSNINSKRQLVYYFIHLKNKRSDIKSTSASLL